MPFLYFQGLPPWWRPWCCSKLCFTAPSQQLLHFPTKLIPDLYYLPQVPFSAPISFSSNTWHWVTEKTDRNFLTFFPNTYKCSPTSPCHSFLSVLKGNLLFFKANPPVYTSDHILSRTVVFLHNFIPDFSASVFLELLPLAKQLSWVIPLWKRHKDLSPLFEKNSQHPYLLFLITLLCPHASASFLTSKPLTQPLTRKLNSYLSMLTSTDFLSKNALLQLPVVLPTGLFFLSLLKHFSSVCPSGTMFLEALVGSLFLLPPIFFKVCS